MPSTNTNTAMSRDRVRFTLTCSIYLSKADDRRFTMVWLLDRCFDPPPGFATWKHAVNQARGHDITVTCRPSQFARFIVQRNKYGFPNSFKELKAELITVPEPMREPITDFDVSINPNRLHGGRHEEDK